MASPPGTPTTEYHPPHLLSSLLPSFPNPSNLLSAVPGAAHHSVLSPPLDDAPSNPNLSLPNGGMYSEAGPGRMFAGAGGGSMRMGSRRGSIGGREGMRRRRSSRSVALVAATLSDGSVDEAMLPPERQRVLEDIRELFAGRPTAEIWQRSFRADCVYEDPLARAVGIRQVAAQFHALPLLFSPHTQTSHVLASTPTQLVLSQVQLYTLRRTRWQKTVQSVVVVDLDPGDKVRALWDLWEGEDVPVKWGAGMLRRLSGIALPWLVRVPKEVLRVEE